jgi:hypothetical protein
VVFAIERSGIALGTSGNAFVYSVIHGRWASKVVTSSFVAVSWPDASSDKAFKAPWTRNVWGGPMLCVARSCVSWVAR